MCDCAVAIRPGAGLIEDGLKLVTVVMADGRSSGEKDGKSSMALSETLKHLNDCVESDDYAQAVGDVYAEEGDDGSRSGSRVSPSSAGPFRSM